MLLREDHNVYLKVALGNSRKPTLELKYLNQLPMASIWTYWQRHVIRVKLVDFLQMKFATEHLLEPDIFLIKHMHE